MTVRVAVLLTTHNRVEKTLSCLEALEAQKCRNAQVDTVLCDAGSSDGTEERVRTLFSSVKVLRAGPELFWNGGMRHAFAQAVQKDYDFYLWLNDDTMLDPHALQALLSTHSDRRISANYPAIIVGPVRDPEGGTITYGGVARPDRRRPLYFETVGPQAEPTEVETMHGNCVLVSRDVVRSVGLLDAGFTHGMGDFDYGLRARAQGVSIWVAPNTVAVCPRNAQVPPATSFRKHLRGLSDPKGLPPREWVRFARRWAGPAWPLYAASPYIRRTIVWVRGAAWRE